LNASHVLVQVKLILLLALVHSHDLTEGMASELVELGIVLVLKDQDLAVIVSLSHFFNVVVLLALQWHSDLVLVSVKYYNFHTLLEVRKQPHQVDPVHLADSKTIHFG